MGYIIQNFNQKRQFLCNVTHTCIKCFTKTIQIIEKILHTSVISESIKFLVRSIKGRKLECYQRFYFIP